MKIVLILLLIITDIKIRDLFIHLFCFLKNLVVIQNFTVYDLKPVL